MGLDPNLLRRQMKARTAIHTVAIQQSHGRHLKAPYKQQLILSGTEAPSRKLKAERACSSMYCFCHFQDVGSEPAGGKPAFLTMRLLTYQLI